MTTPDQPLGIWHIDGVELAPLIERLRISPQPAVDTLRSLFQPEQAQRLIGALGNLGMIAVS